MGRQMSASSWIADGARVVDFDGDDFPAWCRQADAEGLVELELTRAPDRCDTRVARACGTHVVVVRQVRERLGAYPTRPA